MLYFPKVSLEKSKKNFVYNSCIIWNKLVGNIFEKSSPDENGVIIQGSSKNSDFTTSVLHIKFKLKNELLNLQKFGDQMIWVADNVLL